jgi:hypothetical protein
MLATHSRRPITTICTCMCSHFETAILHMCDNRDPCAGLPSLAQQASTPLLTPPHASWAAAAMRYLAACATLARTPQPALLATPGEILGWIRCRRIIAPGFRYIHVWFPLYTPSFMYIHARDFWRSSPKKKERGKQRHNTLDLCLLAIAASVGHCRLCTAWKWHLHGKQWPSTCMQALAYAMKHSPAPLAVFAVPLGGCTSNPVAAF